jgi:hypothetical protein
VNTARTVLPLRIARRAWHRCVVVPLALWPAHLYTRWLLSGTLAYIEACEEDGLIESYSVDQLYGEASVYRCRLIQLEARMRDEF